MAQATATVTGNLTKDVAIRSGKNGKDFLAFTLAYSHQIRQEDGSYIDGDPMFIEVTCNNQGYVNAFRNNETIGTLGNALIVTGSLFAKNWETEDGQKRTSIRMNASDIALIPLFAEVEYRRVKKGEAQEAPAKKAPAKKTSTKKAAEPVVESNDDDLDSFFE